MQQISRRTLIPKGDFDKFAKQLRDFWHGGGRYHVETSPLICSANLLRKSMDWFLYDIGSVMKGLNKLMFIGFTLLMFTYFNEKLSNLYWNNTHDVQDCLI